MHDVQNDVLLDWPKKAYFWQNFYLTKFKIEKKNMDMQVKFEYSEIIDKLISIFL